MALIVGAWLVLITAFGLGYFVGRGFKLNNEG